MKKTIAAILSILMIMSMMTSTAVFAQEAPEAEQIIDIDRADADTAPDEGSYTIVDNGQPLLEVMHVKEPAATAALGDGSTSGYYTAEFMIPESTSQVYLTGLTRDNVSEIRQAIIESYTGGGDFDLKNLGFIDAEKTREGDGDDYMCWAASTANILTYTGWAAQAGFDSADDLFETYIDAFENRGGNVRIATGWFINGISVNTLSQPREGTGNYLPQYNYRDLAEEINLRQNCAAQLATVFDRLKNGYGVSLSVDIYNSTGYEGSHAVTCWGFVTDVRYPNTSKQYYQSVFITDSDSDKYSVQGDTDRRDADDRMSLFTLEPEEQEEINTYRFNITSKQTAMISSAVTVMPFSEEIPYETDPDATLDMINDPDIELDPFVLTDDPDDYSTVTTFAPDTTIYYQPYMMNGAKADYYGDIFLRISVKDSQGNEIYTKNFINHNLRIPASAGLRYNKDSIKSSMPVGDYTITASFNAEHQTTEAHYFNNTRTIHFKIREQYLLGDANGDDVISTPDITKMQRILARMDHSMDEMMRQRCDINHSGDLALPDVTILQRKLARMEVAFPVGETRFYD